jgi:hypothetical protein
MTFFMTFVWILTLAATILASIAKGIETFGGSLCNLYGSENFNTLAAAFVRQITNLN